MKIKIEILNKQHNKSDFDCENESLNRYIKKQASQDFKRKLSVCYVLIDENNKIIGYYTLSSISILHKDLPENLAKKLPQSYRDIPATLLGRLAVDKNYKGKGLGKLLLIDALKKSFEQSKKIASLAVIVDPIDDNAVHFYKKYGFILLDSKKMFMPMKTILKLFANEN